MSLVLLDASYIVALLDTDQRHHAPCVKAGRELTGSLVTCEPVIAEACHLLGRVPGAADAVLSNVESGAFAIPFKLASEAASVRALSKRYRNIPMDLADACLVQLAGIAGTGRILTLDSDFRIYRWGRNRPFEILIDLV